jgi:exodeoxyribonuclease VII large subunit
MVQGDTAPESIIKALHLILAFNKKADNPIDVVVLTRGGGSIEDLWAFNNEALAREIFNFSVPIISGVGHEIDFTISDFICDMRAPTPTAAAELVTEFQFQLRDRLDEMKLGLVNGFENIIQNNKQRLDLLESNIKSPQIVLNEQKQKLKNAELRITQTFETSILNTKQKLELLSQSIKERSPLNKITQLLEGLDISMRDAVKSFAYFLSDKKNVLNKIESNLNAYSPIAVLDRGYAIVQNTDGKAIKSSDELMVGEEITTRLSSGIIDSKIKKINHDN